MPDEVYTAAIVDSPKGRSQKSLVVGNKLRCPNCERVGDPLVSFSQLERNEQYESELNPVYLHRRDRGGCGHCFSPGEPWVMAAYLSGELVPRAALDEALAQLRFMRQQAEKQSTDSDSAVAA